jgi:uncharacterized membrane protein
MKKKRKARFADKVLLVLAITTAIFVIAQFVSFWHSGMEQSSLIMAWFGCVGVELAALISKRVVEKIKGKKSDNAESGEQANG